MSGISQVTYFLTSIHKEALNRATTECSRRAVATRLLWPGCSVQGHALTPAPLSERLGPTAPQARGVPDFAAQLPFTFMGVLEPQPDADKPQSRRLLHRVSRTPCARLGASVVTAIGCHTGEGEATPARERTDLLAWTFWRRGPGPWLPGGALEYYASCALVQRFYEGLALCGTGEGLAALLQGRLVADTPQGQTSMDYRQSYHWAAF